MFSGDVMNRDDLLRRLNRLDEDRLVLLFKGKKIDFYTASLEDIVISKLQSSRNSDFKDIMAQGVLDKINWDELESLACDENETKASALNDFQYTVFMGKYEDYVRRFKDERTDL